MTGQRRGIYLDSSQRVMAQGGRVGTKYSSNPRTVRGALCLTVGRI